MSLDCSIIKVSCRCGYNVELDRNHQKKMFGGDVRVADLSSFYNKFKCSKCDQKNPNVFDKNDNQLFDTKKLIECESCQSFISIPRIMQNQKLFFVHLIVSLICHINHLQNRKRQEKKEKNF